MSVAWKVLEAYRAFHNIQQKADKPKITKASVDAQIAHQRELYRKNHPRPGG